RPKRDEDRREDAQRDDRRQPTQAVAERLPPSDLFAEIRVCDGAEATRLCELARERVDDRGNGEPDGERHRVSTAQSAGRVAEARPERPAESPDVRDRK